MSVRNVPRGLASARVALILGTLLVLVLAVAIVGSVVAVRQLDVAAQAEVTLSDAREELDAMLRAQLDAEAGLRGFVATGQRAFLEPQTVYGDAFDQHAAALGKTLARSSSSEAPPLLGAMRETHRAWARDVYDPLVAKAGRPDRAARETYGKILIDRLRVQAGALREVLSRQNAAVQETLKVEINRVVEASVVIVASIALVGLYLAFASSRAFAALLRERTIVDTLQGVLRSGWDPLPNTEIGTAYVSATQDATVGGDLFDVWRTNERGFVLIADVSGKGIDAAVSTAFVKYAIRTLAAEEIDPGVIARKFNHVYAQTVDDPGMFVVLFLAVIDRDARTFAYASAGHSAAFLRRGGTVRQLPVTGPIVGMMPHSEYRTEMLLLERSDTVLLATDGLSEARDEGGELLGDDAAMHFVEESPEDPQSMCDRIVERVRARSGGRILDDLAILALHFNPAEEQIRRLSSAGYRNANKRALGNWNAF